MSWDYVPVEDGSIASAANLNGIFETARDGLNSIGGLDLAIGAFGIPHGGVADIATSLNHQVKSGENGLHTYSPAVITTGLAYSTWGANGGTSAAGVYTGDRCIVGHPDASGAYSGPTALISGINVRLDGDAGIHGLMVFGNVQVTDMVPSLRKDLAYMLCIQFQRSNSSTWYTVRRSERFWAYRDNAISTGVDQMNTDCAVCTMITLADITGSGGASTDQIQNIRMMHSMYTSGGSGTNTVTLLQWNLNVWQVRTGAIG